MPFMLARGRTTSRCGWSRLGHPAGRCRRPWPLLDGQRGTTPPGETFGTFQDSRGRQDVVWVPRIPGAVPATPRIAAAPPHKPLHPIHPTASRIATLEQPEPPASSAPAAWMPPGCRHVARAGDRIAKLDQPCRARPADRSLVAEDRSAGGVRDQTGPGNPLEPSLVHVWSTRHRTRAAPSGLQRYIVRPGGRCDLGNQARVENPDKEEVPGSCPDSPANHFRSSRPPGRSSPLVLPARLPRFMPPASRSP